jgi:soluble lytic murein transglycosylase-like protein
MGTSSERWADFWASSYGVPHELVRAVIEVESGWNPRAISAKGAMGLMQLMPATAASLGVMDPLDPSQNIGAGVAYLARLLRLFSGDWRLAVAAYYAGESRATRWGLGLADPDVFRHVSAVGDRMRRIGRLPRMSRGAQ